MSSGSGLDPARHPDIAEDDGFFEIAADTTLSSTTPPSSEAEGSASEVDAANGGVGSVVLLGVSLAASVGFLVHTWTRNETHRRALERQRNLWETAAFSRQAAAEHAHPINGGGTHNKRAVLNIVNSSGPLAAALLHKDVFEFFSPELHLCDVELPLYSGCDVVPSTAEVHLEVMRQQALEAFESLREPVLLHDVWIEVDGHAPELFATPSELAARRGGRSHMKVSFLAAWTIDGAVADTIQDSWTGIMLKPGDPRLEGRSVVSLLDAFLPQQDNDADWCESCTPAVVSSCGAMLTLILAALRMRYPSLRGGAVTSTAATQRRTSGWWQRNASRVANLFTSWSGSPRPPTETSDDALLELQQSVQFVVSAVSYRHHRRHHHGGRESQHRGEGSPTALVEVEVDVQRSLSRALRQCVGAVAAEVKSGSSGGNDSGSSDSRRRLYIEVEVSWTIDLHSAPSTAALPTLPPALEHIVPSTLHESQEVTRHASQSAFRWRTRSRDTLEQVLPWTYLCWTADCGLTLTDLLHDATCTSHQRNELLEVRYTLYHMEVAR